MADVWVSKKEFETALRNINTRLDSLMAKNAGSSWKLLPDNAHGWGIPYQIANGHVSFASTGTWRTVAVIEFANNDLGGGYLIFSFGGVQYGVGNAKGVLIGTFDKSGVSNPTFTSLSNIVTACTIQCVADGATKLVVQMKSSSGANLLRCNFSFVVMGSALVTMIVTAPGYSD